MKNQNVELQVLLGAMKATLFGWTEEGHCVECKQAFSDANVFTAAGWKETKQSGMCEACWDATFKPMEDEE